MGSSSNKGLDWKGVWDELSECVNTLSIVLILIATPILLPIATSIGIDPIQFGIIVVLNCSIGLLTPLSVQFCSSDPRSPSVPWKRLSRQPCRSTPVC